MQDFTNGANIKDKTTWIYARPDLAFKPVVVKVPSIFEGGNGGQDWVDGVRKSYEDFKARLDTPPRLDPKVGAIISLSFQIPPTRLDPPAVDYFRTILRSLVSEGVLPITGSGNQANMVNVSPTLCRIDVD